MEMEPILCIAIINNIGEAARTLYPGYNNERVMIPDLYSRTADDGCDGGH